MAFANMASDGISAFFKQVKSRCIKCGKWATSQKIALTTRSALVVISKVRCQARQKFSRGNENTVEKGDGGNECKRRNSGRIFRLQTARP